MWAHNGVAITSHAALVPDMAAELQRPGFSSTDQRPSKALAKRLQKNGPARVRTGGRGGSSRPELGGRVGGR